MGPVLAAARGNGYPTPQTQLSVFEVDLAATPDWGVAIFHQGISDNYRWAAFAVAEYDPNDPNGPWVWKPGYRERRVPRDYHDVTWDPSVAADPDTGDFIAVAMGNGDAQNPGGVLYSVANLDPNTGEPNFPNWEILRTGGEGADKPWIVTGQQTESYGREYYVVWCNEHVEPNWPQGFGYSRTVDGGVHWTNNDDAPIMVGANRVTGDWCAQHTTVADDPDAPIYVAYRTGNTFRFLKGTDDDANLPENPRVDFEYLRSQCSAPPAGFNGPSIPVPLQVVFNSQSTSLSSFVPSSVRALYVPYILADPTDSERFFIVYHDTVEEGPSIPDPEDPNDPNDIDVDVFIRVAEHVETNKWCMGAAVRVNQDTKDPNHPADQFVPAATIDSLGRVHVTFYDDRNYPTQHDEMNGTGPVFDVYYALGTSDPNDPNNPWTWDEQALNTGPALDTDDWFDGTREYHGIAYCGEGDHDEILTAYTGTDPNEPDMYKGVIFSNILTGLP